MSEKNPVSTKISGSLLSNLQEKEHLEAILRPEIMQATGYFLILDSHLQLSLLWVVFNIDDHRVVLYIPEHLSFSLEELKEKVFTTYNDLKSRLTNNNTKLSDVECIHEKLNNKR